ncbi:MAG TPA: hypothetical protein VK817_14405 [Trebonia sp.]|nr:hypothetical protein [Trebonia sp.]
MAAAAVPDEQPGTLDSICSAGQVVPVSFPAGTTTIGLLGSAIDGASTCRPVPAATSASSRSARAASAASPSQV